jgi:hypothetical protein
MNLSFKNFITEEIDVKNVEAAMPIIIKYLKKKTEKRYFRYPGIERFSGEDGKGYGIRFYSTDASHSVRFNWNSSSVNMMALQSVDVFNGKKKKNISFDKKVSLVKTLPLVADVLLGKVKGNTFWTMPDDVSLNENTLIFKKNFLVESSASDVESIYDGVVDMLGEPGFSRLKVYKQYRSAGQKIFDFIVANNSKLIQVVGNKYTFTGEKSDLKKLKDDKEKVLSRVGSVKASIKSGSNDETYDVNASVKHIEDNEERLVYEKQLEHMEHLLKMTIKGSSNAMFIAGRGGVGKTHTVEKVLKGAGLRDGAGYFKNTGSASAAGMYSLLFRYKDKIVLFDDSDDALKDQESRNLLKAATDTKKVRKLVWNKMGKNVVDPDDDLTDEEILDQNLIPRYFDFTGRIIFISNLPMDKLDPDGALRTRAFMIDINPTDAEVYDFMEKIVNDIELEDGLSLNEKERKHVVELLRKGKSKQTANFRKLSRGLNMAAGASAAGVNISDEELAQMIALYA